MDVRILPCFLEEMMTKENPIELEKKENLEKQQILKKKVAVDKLVDCTQ